MFGHFNMIPAWAPNNIIILLETQITTLEANPVDNKFIKVDWTTSKEVDVDYFIIERSTDDANFSPIFKLSKCCVIAPPSGNLFYRLENLFLGKTLLNFSSL